MSTQQVSMQRPKVRTKKRVGIIHSGLEVLGGAEHVCLHTMKALNSMDNEVCLCATAFPEREKTMARVGIDITKYVDSQNYVHCGTDIAVMPLFSIYQRFVYPKFSIKQFIEKHHPDYFFVTQGTTLVPKNQIKNTIMYVHFPIEQDLECEKYSRGFWKFYADPLKFIISNVNYYRDYTLITNSNFTAGVIWKLWKKRAKVIYPPVPQYDFKINNFKENSVCVLSRFTPEKRYEVMCEVARHLPDTEFHFIGGVTAFTKYYARRIQNIAPKNVHFHINASFAEKVRILQKSKVFLHAMKDEHFGIAIVEAMSAGLIPVVHNSGGAKTDSLVSSTWRYEYDGPSQFTDKNQFSYVGNVSDAVDKIQNALNTWTPKYGYQLRDRAKKYSPENFQTKIKDFVTRWLDENKK